MSNILEVLTNKKLNNEIENALFQFDFHRYMSQQLGNKFDHFAETVLPSLTNLIPNSAKVMATAGIVTIRFIIQVRVHSHCPTLTATPSLTRAMPVKLNGTVLASPHFPIQSQCELRVIEPGDFIFMVVFRFITKDRSLKYHGDIRHWVYIIKLL